MSSSKYSKYEPIFGAWYIRKKLGEGSFGEVYEIIREEFGRNYRSALKVLTIPRSDDEIREMKAGGSDEATIASYYRGVVSDIAEENAIMADLKGHSNIVNYEDHKIIPHEDGIGYDVLIRMELLTPLTDRLLEGPMSEDEVIRLGTDLCTALEICGQKNVLHRDIKPANIFLSDTGDFKLGDFGISRTVEKASTELSKKGTFAYMAPEIYKGEPYGPQADIYSLGMVMYYLMNHNRTALLPLPPAPITHHQRMDAVNRRMKGEVLPLPAQASSPLASIIMRACAYDPEDRFASPVEMRQALEDLRQFREKHGADPRAAAAYASGGDEYRTQLLADLAEDATDRDETVASDAPFATAGPAGGMAGVPYHAAHAGRGTGQPFGGWPPEQMPPAGPAAAAAGAGAGVLDGILSNRNRLIALIAAVILASGLLGFLVVHAISGSEDDAAQDSRTEAAAPAEGTPSDAAAGQEGAAAAAQTSGRIVSHKGTNKSANNIPENTENAFLWAAQAGSSYIEMDTVEVDGALYVTNAWGDDEYRDTSEKTPVTKVIDDLRNREKYNGYYVIELKNGASSESMAGALVSLADRYGIRDRIIAESFDVSVLDAIKEISDITTMGLCDLNSGHEENDRIMIGNSSVDIVAVDASEEGLLGRQEQVQNGGQEFGTWMPASAEQEDRSYAGRMLDRGVDYIFTYYTEGALAAKQKHDGGK